PVRPAGLPRTWPSGSGPQRARWGMAPRCTARAGSRRVAAAAFSRGARAAGNVGHIQAKAGTQAALDGLKIAQGPRDLSRIARLAETKGTRTRAILKTLGRGAAFTPRSRPPSAR